jgi:divalent metal cation (Fe/Co/Zn/Cd) transporter
LYEAWHKWSDPHPIDSWQWVPLVVLLVAIAMEAYALRTAVIESNRVRGDRSWTEFVRTAKAPELPVILLEDCGALLGLMFALCGVSMTLLTGEGRWDAAGTAMIGLLLVVIAVILAREMKSLLIGEAASRKHQRAIQEALPGEGVESIVHMRTVHLGPEELLVAAKIAVSAAATGEEVAEAIDAAGALRCSDRPGHLPRTGLASARQGAQRAHGGGATDHQLATAGRVVMTSPTPVLCRS